MVKLTADGVAILAEIANIMRRRAQIKRRRRIIAITFRRDAANLFGDRTWRIRPGAVAIWYSNFRN